MSEREWKPKVGDKVKVVGVGGWMEGAGRITSPGEGIPSWYWVQRQTPGGYQSQQIHIRNLDPVLEDERKGAPRRGPSRRGRYEP